MGNLLSRDLKMATKRQHNFYVRLLDVDQQLIFRLDPIKVRKLSNAYLDIQDTIKVELEYWKDIAKDLKGEQSFTDSISQVMRHLQRLADIIDTNLPERGIDDE
jgi:hypothetical protein